MHTLKLLALLAVLSLPACGAEDDADTEGDTAVAGMSEQAEDDVANVANYRLTMENMDKFFQAQRNLFLAVRDMSPEEREAANLSMGADDSLGEMVDRVESSPIMNAAVQKAGLTAREYVTLSIAYVTTAMAAGVLQMRPGVNQDSLAREMKSNMDNIRFLQQNAAALERKHQEMEAELKRLSVSED